jgi:hypothetical protein
LAPTPFPFPHTALPFLSLGERQVEALQGKLAGRMDEAYSDNRAHILESSGGHEQPILNSLKTAFAKRDKEQAMIDL